MNWNAWHKHYEDLPDLQSRLRLVRSQIAAALQDFPPGPIRILSLCAGDGRDLIGVLQEHPRHHDVTVFLLETDADSVMRGNAEATKAGLGQQFHFLEEDATLAKNYVTTVPADLLLLSGFLGHLRHEDVAVLITALPMFCQTGAQVIWNRHLMLHAGQTQVPAIREAFGSTNFSEVFFEATSSTGFAVSRARFIGTPKTFNPPEVLFRFAGYNRDESTATSTNGKKPVSFTSGNGTAELAACPEAESTIPDRFRQMVEVHPTQIALAGNSWRPTYRELDAVTNQLAKALIIPGPKNGGRVALLLRQDAPLLAAALAVLKAGKVVVVLNPSDPPARLGQILADVEPDWLITDQANEQLAAEIAPTRMIISFEKQISSQPAGDPGPPTGSVINPEDLAWIIYTSGSTGQPKGVMSTHRGILHNVLRLGRGMQLIPADRLTLLNSPSSGLGVATAWCALLHGATLFPFPLMGRGMAGLKTWLRENRITVWTSSASVFRTFARTLEAADAFPEVRLVRFGSETAMTEDLAAVRRHFPGECILFNSLSSSETGNITHQVFTREMIVATGRLPVGKPAMGIDILLLDENGEQVSNGDTGEMLVRSRYLSPGYWRNDALTASRFQENAGGVRVFRSGDLARRLPDGSLMFMDRQDRRVKIHGYRVELSEIEDTLRAQPEIENAFVSPRAEAEIEIAAHVVLKIGQNCTAGALRERLRKTLPPYMVPAHFIFLDQFPLTSHGKIDQEKLQQIAPPVSAAAPTEAPVTDTEIRLAEIWQKIFTRKAIGRTDDFFDIGGDSLHATVIAAQLQAALHVEVELAAFTKHPILFELAKHIDSLPRSGSDHALTPIVRAPRDQPLPLSFIQERTWKYSQTPEGMLAYTMAAQLRICGPLNAASLRASMTYLISRHESLRTTFDQSGEQPVQIVHPPGPAALTELDFSTEPGAGERAIQLMREELRRGFDLQRGPLMRFILVRIRKDEHWLLRFNHHLISDGWSWGIYFRELAQLYEAKQNGQPPPLPEFQPLHYVDHAAHERRTMNHGSAAYQAEVDWWVGLVVGKLRQPALPFRRARPLRTAKAADGFIWWGLEPGASKQLNELACAEDVTFYTLRLAAFAALLSDWASGSDLIVGTFATGRHRVETQNMFGDFANLITLRLRCDHGQTFRDWLLSVHQKVDEARAHSSIPYEQLREDLRQRGVKLPEVPVIFSVTAHTADLHFGGLEITWPERPMEHMPWGFSLTCDQPNEDKRSRLNFDPRIHDPVRVRQWLARYQKLLTLVSQNPHWTIDQLLTATRPPRRWNIFRRAVQLTG